MHAPKARTLRSVRSVNRHAPVAAIYDFNFSVPAGTDFCEAANGCPGLPRTAANNVKSFLARQKVNCRRAAREAALGRVRAKKLFSHSECRAVGEAQSGVKTLQKAGLGLTFA